MGLLMRTLNIHENSSTNCSTLARVPSIRPSDAGKMKRRDQLHEIRRRERIGQIERRAGFFALRQPVHDRRMPDTQIDHPYLELQMRDKRSRMQIVHYHGIT